MKRLFFLITVLLSLSHNLYAADGVTQFLGIPVDGPKSEMIQKLKAMGYEYVEGEDFFTGYYFGNPVYLFIQTNNDKVSRIILYDINQRTEEEIKYRFNALYDKFATSDRYVRLGKKDVILTEKDKLAYEMKQHNRIHKAVFRQIKETDPDLNMSMATAPAVGVRQIELDKLKFDYKERRRRMHARAIGYVNRHNQESFPSQVWFVISERFGKFGMVMLYDNVPNLLSTREPHVLK